MRKTFALYVILATMLCGHAVASRTAIPGEYRGFVDQPAGWIQTAEGGATVLVVERRHEFFVGQGSGESEETAYRYQYLFFSQARPEQRQGEKARRLHPGFELRAASGLQEERVNPAFLARLLPGAPQPVGADPIQDVIDELEGYKSTIARIAARSEGEQKTCLEMAVMELDKAIAKLKLLQAGSPPPGIEGQIEGHLDAAIAAIAKTHPVPDSTLDRIMKALQNLRAHLF